MSESILVRNLSKSYGPTRAVDDLSLAVEKGAFFGFLGPNGAGKTTTIRILTGVLKADRGECAIAGLPLRERNRIAQIIGIIPESRGQYEWMTGSEYLQFFANLYGISRAAREATVDSLLSQVELTSRQHTTIATYSRGMKQRLALARALINRPEVLFLDEPTLGLDPQGQEEIQNLLRNLNAQGVTIFLSSHLLHEVSNLCTRIAIIHQGKLVAEGSLDSLRRDANFRESYRIRLAGDLNALPTAQFADRITTEEVGTNFTEITFRGNAEEANQLLDSLRARRMSILEFRAETGNLTDIFLTLTGR
jgi:ABC-2 type transport system ATP-binding protein